VTPEPVRPDGGVGELPGPRTEPELAAEVSSIGLDAPPKEIFD
jgi:hypothetical protein